MRSRRISLLYDSSVRSNPSGTIDCTSASARARPSSPPSSYWRSHFFRDCSVMWLAWQKSLRDMSWLPLYWRMRNSFSSGLRCFAIKVFPFRGESDRMVFSASSSSFRSGQPSLQEELLCATKILFFHPFVSTFSRATIIANKIYEY